jgi:hypothetical protein
MTEHRVTPGESLRQLIAKWRDDSDKSKLSEMGLRGLRERQRCADELESALSALQPTREDVRHVALLEKITRWLTSPPAWDNNDDKVAACELLRAAADALREGVPIPPQSEDQIEVCLGCGAETSKRDCGCPAGTGWILARRECVGCGTVKAQCDAWRRNGKVACCPDCKHPRGEDAPQPPECWASSVQDGVDRAHGARVLDLAPDGTIVLLDETGEFNVWRKSEPPEWQDEVKP